MEEEIAAISSQLRPSRTFPLRKESVPLRSVLY